MGFKIGHQVGEWDHEFQNYPIMVTFLIIVLKVCIFFSKLPYNGDLYDFRYKTLFFILKFPLLFYFFVSFGTQINYIDYRLHNYKMLPTSLEKVLLKSSPQFCISINISTAHSSKFD